MISLLQLVYYWNIYPSNPSVSDILLFLQFSLDKGLALVLLKFTALLLLIILENGTPITSFHILFIAKWLKGAAYYPTVKDMVSKWDLQIVLNSLMIQTF